MRESRKKRLKKSFLLLTSLILILSTFLTACGNSAAPTEQGSNNSNDSGKSGETQQAAENYPTKPINGIIQWGAGGATDNIARAIAPLAEEKLGQSIVLINKPGATGAIATQYVIEQKSDGYHLLFAAENPALYGVLDISQVGFQDLYPVNIFARGLGVVIVPKNSKYQTLQDLIDDAKANPGKIKMGSTGPGGIPFVVTAMISNVTNTEFNMVPFDGDGPAITALLGGHVDVFVSNLAAATENLKAGKIKVLAVVNDQPIPELPNVPAITETLPDMKKFLPWGPFYGVWVKKDTPEPIKQKLVDAFAEAYQTEKFQKLLKDLGAIPLGISGEEAEKFWRDWQSTTAWLIHDAGQAKKSPEELGIPKKQ